MVSSRAGRASHYRRHEAGTSSAAPCDTIRQPEMPFRSIVGHRHVVELLVRAVARESLPPSLILSGPEGVGKRRVAVALAQALNCPTKSDGPTVRRSGGRALDLRTSGPPDPRTTNGCGTCAVECPQKAIAMVPEFTGDRGVFPLKEGK